MQDVCKGIPVTLSDVDFKNTGRNRGCHQRVTMNLNHLQTDTQATSQDTQPSSSRSPGKRSSVEGNKFAFPQDTCLFCDQLWS